MSVATELSRPNRDGSKKSINTRSVQWFWRNGRNRSLLNSNLTLGKFRQTLTDRDSARQHDMSVTKSDSLIWFISAIRTHEDTFYLWMSNTSCQNQLCTDCRTLAIDKHLELPRWLWGLVLTGLTRRKGKTSLLSPQHHTPSLKTSGIVLNKRYMWNAGSQLGRIRSHKSINR